MSCSLVRLAFFLVGMGFACSGIAQQNDAPAPDAPSAILTPKKQSTRKQIDFKLLMNRSKVFPDLALNEYRLSAKQKMQLSVNDSLSLAAVGGSLFSAGLGQARDNLHGYGQGAQGFGKRFGASMATSASTQFFGTFLFATLFEQDPRFFVRENLGIRQSLVYGLRRTLITRTDDGQETLNTSGLFGPLAAQGLANTYLPDEERTAGRTMQRYGTYLALRTGVNLAKQYRPTIFKSLTKAKQKKKGGNE